MVTIGPLIVLGLLGVTFKIGARPLRPVATGVPISRQASGRSQPGRNNVQAMEPPTPGPVLPRARTSITSSQDAFQAREPPRSGPVFRGHQTSAASDDNLTWSRSERLTRRAGFGAGRQRTAAVNSEDSIVLSRNGRSTTAGAFADNHRPAGTMWKSSVTHRPPENSEEATVDGQNSAMVHTRGEGELEAPPDRPAGLTEESLGKSQRSMRNVWIAGTGNEAHPEQVKQNFA